MSTDNQTWKFGFNAAKGTIQCITRVDNKVRQEFDVSLVHPNHQPMLLIRGLKVLLEERTSTTPASNVEAKVAARQEYFELLQTPFWAKQRVGGGFTVAIHFDAIARLTGKTVQDAREAFKALPAEKQKALLESERVKKAVAEIEAERDKGSVSLDDFLTQADEA